MQCLLKYLCIIISLGMISCGHPSLEMVFNTSTESYPVSTTSTVLSSGLTVTSVVRIHMEGVAEAKMRSVWLQDLVLKATEGSLGFVKHAKCYVKSRESDASEAILIGTATADGLSADQKHLKFQVDSGPDLAPTLKGPFSILVEIEGDGVTEKTSVSGDLTFKAHVEI